MIDVQDSGSDERLRRIEAVTDAALSQLDVNDLMEELLERVREVLKVETAAILLLDVHAQQFVATATKGLGTEVRQGARTSVGHGFAGRIAQEKQPVLLADLAATDDPDLFAGGVRSLLGVPMLAGGEVIGVIHVGCLQPHQFTSVDVQLLQLAADRASLATRTRASGLDRTAALALQRSLLPTHLPDAPGVDMAARYVPGHDAGVGGDWYDVFTLPSGWLGVVIGDVSGHGLRSAVVMGRLRSALRAYALVCDDPASALTLLDRKIHHFEAGSLATVLYAMISPDRTTIQVSLAGHLQPILASPGRPAEALTIPVDLPLGIGPRQPARRCTEVAFPSDAVLVCYTDGLVERRGEIIDEGVERLRAAVEPGSAEKVCARIMSMLAGKQATDDIALLAIHTADRILPEPRNPEAAA
ncbi:SpoIIE family protein phosphatase [Micromonospora sp. RHAY321]|uniref:PP2C family protein-serine/threonine phosphatase n=1 Tax=Micromonospora sp. RHAY321 TaxID=2944807 RepID=UPI00207D278D|nr:GAF domain-containing SpoIIE family protein phosphatase [Micromonospora sp. RHAY321]MCO1594536.1 SpoIIE family protein phosphatase [Micromonospora sp. RHAY321]